MSERRVVIVGGGPAGLTAAYQLSKLGRPCVVLEKDACVGGISRTVNHQGYHFDIGGHRFFTKVESVEKMWKEVLPGEEFMVRGRLSRIYYNKKFFHYPLRPANALFGLGIFNSVMMLFSYAKAQVFRELPEATFEQWVSNRFGKRLYHTFFKTYTEKVWGIPASEISADWAAQRIRELSFITALKSAFLKQNKTSKGGVIKTLIGQFHYPQRGPGMMWERVTDLVREAGNDVAMETDVEAIRVEGGRVVSARARRNGEAVEFDGDDFISSMPLRELVEKIEPAAPAEVREAAGRLRYRDFLTVALIIDQEHLFPDNWIYIHDPDVKVGRIQNFKNWSPHMVPDPSKSCLGLEYFCFEGDGLWTTSDEDLIELGAREIDALGLARRGDVSGGAVVRMPKAYPVYDGEYQEALAVMRSYLDSIGNLQVVGRNGMHKYNNQDHSMLTAMLAVENLNGESWDLWGVNADDEGYHEEVTERETKISPELAAAEATQPHVPAVASALRFTLAKIHKSALGTATGLLSGLVLFLATWILLWKGGEEIGPTLWLLSNYLPGYAVTSVGSWFGLGWGFVAGFVGGFAFGLARNLYTGLAVLLFERRAEAMSLRSFLDEL